MDLHRFRSTLLAASCFAASFLAASPSLASDDPKSATPASAPADRFQLADLFALEWVDDPQFSPDGSRIVFERHSGDIMTDRYRSDLWVIGADGAGLEALTTDGRANSSPRWSPDGERLCYFSAVDGTAQLWVRWIGSGRSTRITSVQQAPTSAAWSADGKWIGFTMFVPAPAEPLASMPPKPEGATWARPAQVIRKVMYRADGAGYLEDGFQQIFVVPADGGTPRPLTTEPFHHMGPLRFAKDGHSIFCSANRRDDWEYAGNDSEICEVPFDGGAIRELTSRDGPDQSPALSPDGAWIAYTGFDDRFQGYQVTRLHVMRRDGSASRCLTAAFDRDVGPPAWSRDGASIFFAYDERGNTMLAACDLEGKVTTYGGDVGGVSWGRPYAGGAFSVGPHGRVAFTHTRPDHPAELAVQDTSTAHAESRLLTRFNEDLFAMRKLGAVAPIEYASSFDQRKIQGWVVTPPGFDATKKHPLVLEIHGGPFANYGDRFAAEMQLYAAAGYVVLYVNPRGSTSYGEEFGNLIHHDYPNHDYEDLMSGVDAMLARGWIDPHNLFVTGGSGGGLLTAWIVGKTDRFRAAVVAKPVINWTSFVLTADGASEFIRYWFPGTPWDKPEEYARRSPLTYVGNVSTPTMLLTGEADYRTPISESEQFYEALKQRRIEAALVRVPEASHGFDARPTELVTKVAHILAWFEKHRTRE